MTDPNGERDKLWRESCVAAYENGKRDGATATPQRGVPHELQEITDAAGGKIDWVAALPDGSGAATMSFPLPADHWLTRDGHNVPPMPFRMGNTPMRREWAAKINAAGRYAIRGATMNGKEQDFDPDAMLQNLCVGMLGYWTEDGTSNSCGDPYDNPDPIPPRLDAAPAAAPAAPAPQKCAECPKRDRCRETCYAAPEPDADKAREVMAALSSAARGTAERRSPMLCLNAAYIIERHLDTVEQQARELAAAKDELTKRLEIIGAQVDRAERAERDRDAARAAIAAADVDAARDVLAERSRQVSAECWTSRHDDKHRGGEMALAASGYALSAAGRAKSMTPANWPWHALYWKPTTPRRDLVKAGALILAEIERLDRAAARAKVPHG